MRLMLRRFIQEESYTLGYISLGEKYVFLLELGWHENKRRISCIPCGSYHIEIKERKDWNTPRLIITYPPAITEYETPSCVRFAIHMHPANHTYEILGCMAPGCAVRLSREASTSSSKDALEEVIEYVREHKIKQLVVRNMA